MISKKKQVQQLAALLLRKNIIDVVISPGSRNGAMIHSIANDPRFRCFNLVDERSAGYYALGRAQALRRPVALLCTSGTAALNYSPAVAEAFYQQVPLVLITCDRPAHLINQLEAQCINQRGIYQNFVCQEVQLPLSESAADLSMANREINMALNACERFQQPVHINLPMDEPLYELEEDVLDPFVVRNICQTKPEQQLSLEKLEILLNSLNQADRIMIILGQMLPTDGLAQYVELFADSIGAVVISEPLANAPVSHSIDGFDMILGSASQQDKEKLAPDIVISLGGQLVSKHIKSLLRSYSPVEHWHISEQGLYADTYQSLSEQIPVAPSTFFEQMLAAFYDVEIGFDLDSTYRNAWQQKQALLNEKQIGASKNIPFCDWKAYEQIKQALPADAVLHLGNSTAIRYAINVGMQASSVLCNRGTSGIDGCLSTAVGYTLASDKLNTIVLGDLSFFYDSNALWNADLPDNLRIILINNGGGNIFELIPGPDKSPALAKQFVAKHDFNAKGIASSFKVNYLSASNEQELNEQLDVLYKSTRGICLLEVFTDAKLTTKVYKEIFETINNN